MEDSTIIDAMADLSTGCHALQRLVMTSRIDNNGKQ